MLGLIWIVPPLASFWAGTTRLAPKSQDDQNSSDHRAMANETRSYRFTMTVNFEPGHPAYDDPEWAADAARGALSDGYGLRAIYTDIEAVRLEHPL